jgi:hypothetical protein
MTNLGWGGKIAFGMGLSLYLLVSFWLFWPYEPIVIHDIKIMNPDSVVYLGEDLVYETDYTKEKSYPVANVTRQIVDGTVIVLGPGKKSRIPIGSHKLRVHVRIPENCCVGVYRFHLTAEYQVNLLRTVTATFITKPFEIRKR